MWDQVERLYGYHGDVPVEARLLKLTEEVGEVAEAYIGIQGLNNRKGTCKTPDDLLDELADVIITAAVAMSGVAGDADQARWIAPASLEAAMSANCLLSYQIPVPYNRFPRTLSAAYLRSMSEASPRYTRTPSPSWRASHHRLPAIPS